MSSFGKKAYLCSVMILGFSIYAWITMVTIVVTFGVLLFTKLRADFVFLGVIGVLFVTGVLLTIAGHERHQMEPAGNAGG